MVAKSISEFTVDLEKFAEQIDVDIGLVRKKVAFDLFGKLVERSPVDTGRFRGSWTMSDSSPDPRVLPEGALAYPPATAEGQRATFAEPFDKTYIVNALPYANRLEFDGWSRQAPNGFARISIAEIEAELLSLMPVEK